MRASRQMSITLPVAMADDVRARVASGRYTSESEVIRDGLRALADREQAVEDWLRGPVLRDYAAWKAGELETVSLQELRDELARDRAAGR